MPVIVYSANLCLLATTVCSSLLSNEERGQAARIANNAAREEFVKSRALLRGLLAQHTGVPAQNLDLVAGPFGKPQLADGCGLHFNISHSGGMALVAISSEEIGIDIERMDMPADHRGVAQTVFAPSEIETLESADASNLSETFFSLWTRKEAYLKATGQGFSSDLGAISTAAGARVQDASCEAGDGTWYVHDLPVQAGFKAALATPFGTPDVTLINLGTAREIAETCPALAPVSLAAA